MDLLKMAITFVVVTTVVSNPCCQQMCNRNCTRQTRGIKIKVNELQKNREDKTEISSPGEELHKAHAPHERMQDESNKLKKGKEDWVELAGGHDDDLDRDHGKQYLEMLTSMDSEITSIQATNVDEDTDRYDDIIQF